MAIFNLKPKPELVEPDATPHRRELKAESARNRALQERIVGINRDIAAAESVVAAYVSAKKLANDPDVIDADPADTIVKLRELALQAQQARARLDGPAGLIAARESVMADIKALGIRLPALRLAASREVVAAEASEYIAAYLRYRTLMIRLSGRLQVHDAVAESIGLLNERLGWPSIGAFCSWFAPLHEAFKLDIDNRDGPVSTLVDAEKSRVVAELAALEQAED
jgi:hypothetical protein